MTGERIQACVLQEEAPDPAGIGVAMQFIGSTPRGGPLREKQGSLGNLLGKLVGGRQNTVPAGGVLAGQSNHLFPGKRSAEEYHKLVFFGRGGPPHKFGGGGNTWDLEKGAGEMVTLGDNNKKDEKWGGQHRNHIK